MDLPTLQTDRIKGRPGDPDIAATDEPHNDALDAGPDHEATTRNEIDQGDRGGAQSTETNDDSLPTRSDARAARRRMPIKRMIAFILLPFVAVLIAGLCGSLKWQVARGTESNAASIQSVQAAKDSTAALLSYSPDTVDKQLGAARDLLTGTFRDSYTSLTHDVVIPAAKQKHISAAATVSAAASVSASPAHAVALVFVDQTTIVGSGAPTGTSSVVRVTLDKIDGRWLISSFDPI